MTRPAVCVRARVCVWRRAVHAAFYTNNRRTPGVTRRSQPRGIFFRVSVLFSFFFLLFLATQKRKTPGSSRDRSDAGIHMIGVRRMVRRTSTTGSDIGVTIDDTKSLIVRSAVAKRIVVAFRNGRKTS